MSATSLDGFLGELVRHLRAADTHGQLDAVPDIELLDPYVIAPSNRRQIPLLSDIDARTAGRLRSFFESVAGAAEARTGVMTSVVLDLSHEGFGRVVLFAGRLVLVTETLRDAHRFGFASLDELAARGESLVAEAVEAVETHPEVASDD
jgi:probable nitrogen fixation protein